MLTKYKARWEFSVEADSPDEAARAVAEYVRTSIDKAGVTLVDETGAAVTLRPRTVALRGTVAAGQASLVSGEALMAAPSVPPGAAPPSAPSPPLTGYLLMPERQRMTAGLEAALAVAGKTETGKSASVFLSETAALEVARGIARAGCAFPFVPVAVVLIRK